MQSKKTFRTLPSGWFQIGWSHELSIGAVLPIRVFGEDLVLCRYESGEIGLFDAYCPHLCANIGYGGTTIGDTLACPYHGWRFDRTGCNTHIPYSDRVNRSVRLRAWNVKEVGGTFIFAWHSPDGSSPYYEPPDESMFEGIEDSAYFDINGDTTRRYANLPMLIDFVTENTVDMSHFKFVHETPEIGTILELDPIDHRFNIRFSMPMKLYRSDGGGEIVDAVTELTCWGLGLIVARFADGATLLQSQTPIDDALCDVMMTMVLPRGNSESATPSGKALARFKMACRQVENDIVIWSHRQPDLPSHLIADEVGPFRTFAKWKSQFYGAVTDRSDKGRVSTPSRRKSSSKSEVDS